MAGRTKAASTLARIAAIAALAATLATGDVSKPRNTYRQTTTYQTQKG